MIRHLVAALVAASLVAPAAAQAGTPPQPKRQTAPSTRGPDNRSDKLIERIAAALDLNEEQRQELIEIVRDHPGKGQQVRKLRRELLQAVAAKDDQRSTELQEQLQQIRDSPSNPMALILDELEPILSDRQALQLRRLQNPHSQSGPQSTQVDPRDLERLREELELTDEQNRRFREIVASASQTEPGASQLQMKSIGRALQRARQEGNSERAAELETQLRELGKAGSEPSKDVFARLASILTESQIQVLHKFQAGLSPARTRRDDDVRYVLRAAKKLDLSAEQRGELRGIEREARKSRVQLRGQSADVRAKFARELKDAIRSMLEAAQIEQFEKNLEYLVELRQRSRGRGADQP